MRLKMYADVAFFCKMSITSPILQKDYQYKAAGVIHSMETIGLISIKEFLHMTEMLWDSANLIRLFEYTNSLGGKLYEIQH